MANVNNSDVLSVRSMLIGLTGFESSVLVLAGLDLSGAFGYLCVGHA
jgi:hypothetical protein